MVVVDQNPFKTEVQSIIATKVTDTILGGHDGR